MRSESQATASTWTGMKSERCANPPRQGSIVEQPEHEGRDQRAEAGVKKDLGDVMPGEPIAPDRKVEHHRKITYR